MSTFNKYRTKGAYHYQWFETEAWYRECVEACVDFCRGTTIDVGCGDGLLLSKLPKGSQGLEPDMDGAALAAEYSGVEPEDIWVVEAKDIVGQLKYEYMACLNVIEHMDDPESLKEIIKKNITKGAIIITNQYQGGSLGEDHRKEYDYQELIDFFKEFKPKGFKLADGEYIGVKIKL